MNDIKSKEVVTSHRDHDYYNCFKIFKKRIKIKLKKEYWISAIIALFISFTLMFVVSEFAIPLLFKKDIVKNIYLANATIAPFLGIISYLILDYYIFWQYFYPRFYHSEQLKIFLTSSSISIDDSGISEVANDAKSFIGWNRISDIESVNGYIVFWFDMFNYIHIPIRSFSSQEEAQKFLQQAKTFWEKAKEQNN